MCGVVVRGLAFVCVLGASVAGAPPAPVDGAEPHPGAVLGRRAHAQQRQALVVPVVVIVGDERSYIEAIARWTPKAHYPVLWDDNSDAARENIARFVRGFRPARVLRWTAPDEPAPDEPAPDEPPTRARREEARRERIESALARAWGAPEGTDYPSLVAHVRGLGHVPAGVVLGDERDDAWPAALALAAGRGQPIAWVRVPRRVDAALTLDEARLLVEQAETAAERTRLEWRGLGDDVDAVTVCLNAPAKVAVEARNVLAMTDVVGRVGVIAGGEGGRAVVNERGARWAWCGQVFGDESLSAYRAMSGLFMAPGRAWLFDGYPNEDSWSAYDATRASVPLRGVGIDTEVDDTPAQGLGAWQARASRVLDAGLVLVNSKGNADAFELAPGRGVPGDTPSLRVPAMAHVVHSWSLARPGDPATVGGRWLQRGVYAYAGSVQEPFLQAFVPTPVVASRIAGGLPWGAAVRYDDAPAWRVAVIGDPLIVPAPRPRVGPEELDGAMPDLPGATDVGEATRRAVSERRFAEAMGGLVLLGRDDAAARLAEALLKDEPGEVTPEVARLAAPALFREGRGESLARVWAKMGPTGSLPVEYADMLWNACRPMLAGRTPGVVLDVLSEHVRPASRVRDAAELHRALARERGEPAGRAFLDGVRAGMDDPGERERLDKAVRGR